MRLLDEMAAAKAKYRDQAALHRYAGESVANVLAIEAEARLRQAIKAIEAYEVHMKETNA